MKIQRYPGKAVDASLSLDRNNAMVELYEANWYQAHQNFGQTRGSDATSSNSALYVPNTSEYLQQSSLEDVHSIPSPSSSSNGIYTGGSYLKEGVSTLSKYQMNLEQVRALERQSKDETVVHTLKDLNGYKPSTLRQKAIKPNNDWDKPVSETTLPNDIKSLDTSSTSGYGTEKRPQRPRQQISIKPPSLKRSQTMIYNTRPSQTSFHNPWLNYTQHSKHSAFHPNGNDSDKYQTVILKQPQPLKKHFIPANNCDSSLSSFTTKDENLAQALPVSTAKPRPVTNVNRSKSVRFPSHTEQQASFSTMSKPINRTSNITRHRKISLDIKQDLQNGIAEIRENFENLSVNSKHSSSTLHSRQNSDSSTSSAQSSNTSSKGSQKLTDQFVIPRPRLIVPVHTYARKRRTGNLKEQDLETINNEDNDISDGKMT